MTSAVVDLPYGPPLACTPPALRRPDGVPLPPGFGWACLDCGAQWWVRATIAWQGVYDIQWSCIRTPGVPDPVQLRLAALEGRTVTLRRALPKLAAVALGAGAKLEVPVEWVPPFPDAVYDVAVVLPDVLVGKVTVTTKTQTKAGVVVVLTAKVAVVPGSALDVTATRYGAPA